MQQAYIKVTNRTAKVDNKTSVISENRKKSQEVLEQEQNWKVGTLELTEEFKREYKLYYGNIQEWKAITGKDNIFPFNPQRIFNKKTYGP